MAISGAPGGYQAPMTFSALQKQGVARPPSPAYSAPANPQVATEQKTQMQNGSGQTLTTGGSKTNPTVNGQSTGGISYVPNGVQTIGTSNVSPNGGMQAGPGPQQIGSGMFQNPQTQQGPGLHWQMGGGMFGQQQHYNTQPGNMGQDLYNQWRQSQQPFQPGANPFSGNPLAEKIGQQLNNPSAYNSDMVKNTYNMLNTQLGQDYDYQRNQLQAEMARRGIDASTIHGQRYSDLATEQARAQQNLAYNLINDQARQYGQDMSTAINNALGYNNQQFNQGQTALNNYLGYGQQQWQNQFNTDQFNADQNQQMNQLLLQLLGGLG